MAILGLSNTSSAYGPLPLNLAVFGAPGCWGRVSADATAFLFGSGGSASYFSAIPNQAQLIGVGYFTQALVLDAVNPLGAIMSDAAAARIGL